MTRQSMEPGTFKAFRQRFSLTQVEAAHLCGVDRRTVINWEKSTKPQQGPVVAFLRTFMMLTDDQRQALIEEARQI